MIGRAVSRFCLLAVVLCVVSLKAMDEEGSKAMILGFVSGCQTKEGASDDDVERLFNKTLPTTTEGKCLSACMMEEFGVIKEGKFDPKGFLEITKMATDNTTIINNAEVLAEDCKECKDPDRCKLALSIMDCMEKAAEARGIEA